MITSPTGRVANFSKEPDWREGKGRKGVGKKEREWKVGEREMVEEGMGETGSTYDAKWTKLLGTPSPPNFTPPSQHLHHTLH